ncbi:MAG: hypothetical protein VR65_00990 [Desulfobulbaceae bacterium BRH_c16a]|nr:MAG: hypothetical protein VR65_00990 [Desulfobulbaceae bacterium BRH_c16a]
MKGKLCRSLVVVITIVSATVGLAMAANPSGSAPDNVPRFLGEIEKAGFSSQEGSFSFFDLIKEVCEGGDRYFSAMGNNPWPNAYFVLQMPNPDDVDYQLPFAMNWQMRQDEAMVLIGQTPPPVRYFGLQTWVNMGPASPAGAAVTDNRTLTGAAFGDSINNDTIRTTGSDPFNRPVVYIVTGNRQTEKLVRKAVLAAGYPEAIINVERLSTVIGPLGYGPAGSILLTAQRFAVPADKSQFEDYVRRSIDDAPDNDLFRAFRVSPKNELTPDPYPAPTLRVRGTGQTEMDLYPALKSLGKAILAKEEAVKGMPYKELGVRFWQDLLETGQLELVDEPWSGLQNGQFSYQGTRDANYWQTYPPFKLRSNVDEYVIVYGVNHYKTGKAAYTSFSAYVEPVFGTGREIGLGTVTDPDLDRGGNPGDSARRYLQPNDPGYEYADMLYAWKIARHCGNEPYCLEVGNPTDINGVPYNDDCSPQIDLEIDPSRPSWASDVFVAFRNYLEPATGVSADSNELVWDRAIYFGPYFSEQ